MIIVNWPGGGYCPNLLAEVLTTAEKVVSKSEVELRYCHENEVRPALECDGRELAQTGQQALRHLHLLSP